ncbi:MAG: MBL fold metallo-hydrolase [Phycisphaerae bacterium]|nr:MBL fold metallo-hydrolase [Phycisphaerae bacterium]
MPAHRAPRETAKRTLRQQTAAALNRLRRYGIELPRAVRDRGRGTLGRAPLSLDGAHEAPLAAAWLGHASVLLRIGGSWVLTDPVFSERIGIPVGPVTIGLGRLMPPIDPARLPAIDTILISHAHFDHLDKPTLKALASRRTRIITAEHTGRLIPRGFGKVDEIAWGEEIDLGPLRVRAVRPRHWGARLSLDKHRGYNSYVIDSDDRRVLYAGDTAHTDSYTFLARDQRPTDLSIFGIGAYEPWIHAHANPEQVWEMHTGTGAARLLPMHHSTFKLSDEPRDEPLKRLLAAAGKAAPTVVGRHVGEVWKVE